VSARITREEVAHVASLARLELSEDQLEHFTSHLGDVLDHASEIESLDLEGVEPTTHPLPLRNVMRDDLVGETLDRSTVLASAPDAVDGKFGVPSILGDGS